MSDFKHEERRIEEIAKAYCADYPNIESCTANERLWAIESSMEGVMAANRELHKVIRAMRKELGLEGVDKSLDVVKRRINEKL